MELLLELFEQLGQERRRRATLCLRRDVLEET